MVSFPPELLGAIVAEVHSLPDLLRLRETNITLNEFATPLAFRSVVLANRDKSIQNFRLISTSRLALFVREVIFQYMELDPNRKNEPVSQYAPRGYDGTAFVGALGHFAHLDSLESLVLHLRQDDGPFTVDVDRDASGGNFPGEIMLQFLIFKALSENPTGFIRPLKSLTVDKLLPLPNPSIASPPVIALLSKLNHLAIKTTIQCAAIPMTDPRLEWSIPDSLFQREVVPASLVSLELHHTNIRSADVLIPVARIHLPRLERLSLQRTYFSDQGALESFIARHGATLVELKMFLCPMALSTSSVSTVRPRRFRRWSQVWGRFDRDLKALRNLVVSERLDSKGVEDASYSRYLDNCYRCNAAKLGQAEIVEDNGALKQFEKNVESRSRQ
jgi:hypothetical protein